MQDHNTSAPVKKRRVVDALTRTMHALMAVSFGLAYITSEMDGLRWLHVTMGYTLGAVFLLRVVWGLLGPRRVSLWSLGGRLSGIHPLPSLVRQRDGQALLKLMLAFSMVALLVCVLPVVATGYVTYFEWLGEWAEDIHESLANFMLLVVGCHVGTLVLLGMGKHGQPVRPMLTGRVQGQGPDLVKHNLAAAAIALLLLVGGFWTWQSYQSIVDPQFTQQPRWLHPEGGYDGDD